MTSGTDPFYNIYVEVLLVAFFALGRVSALSISSALLTSHSPGLFILYSKNSRSIRADCTIHLTRTSSFHPVFVSTSSPRHDEHFLKAFEHADL